LVVTSKFTFFIKCIGRADSHEIPHLRQADDVGRKLEATAKLLKIIVT